MAYVSKHYYLETARTGLTNASRREAIGLYSSHHHPATLIASESVEADGAAVEAAVADRTLDRFPSAEMDQILGERVRTHHQKNPDHWLRYGHRSYIDPYP
jgi:hypothetical protein